MMENEKIERYIVKVSEYLNMQKVCKLSGVNYNTYKGWRYKQSYMAIEKKKAIMDTIQMLLFENCMEWE